MMKHKKDVFRFELEEGERIVWQAIRMGFATCITENHVYTHYLDDQVKKNLLKHASKEAFYPKEDTAKIRISDIVKISQGKSKLREIMIIELSDGSKITPLAWGKDLDSVKRILISPAKCV